MAAAGQEHRRVPTPARGALDPPTGDLPKLPGPRLQLAVPLARDTKVSRTQDPAARIGDRRGQRAFVRIDPDDIARMIGAINKCDGPGPPCLALLIDLTSSGMLLADRPTTSRWTPPRGERSYQVRPTLEGTNRGRHFASKTPSPESIAF